MNGAFYREIQGGLSSERLEAYAVRQPGFADDPAATLARYLLNMALCESLYSPLQLCEIALRNAIHHHVSSLMAHEYWFDDSRFQLTTWADALDRFQSLRRSGLTPWLEKLRRHWPDSTADPASSAESIATVETPFDATHGAQTPFGHRWGGDVFSLTHRHLETIQQGQTLALDVMGEYVVFLKAEAGGLG